VIAVNHLIPTSSDMEQDERMRLEAWLDVAGVASGSVTDVVVLSGGTQNILMRFCCGGARYVLRRPAQHARPGADATIQREATVLRALAGTTVPHPRFRGVCTDHAVLGAAFLVTDAVEGFNATVEMPPPARDEPRIRKNMGLAMVDGIVALAKVDHRACGLSAFGRLDDFIDRQVPRWARQLASYADLAGWPGPQSLQGIDVLGRWLEANRPAEWHGGVMHGDFHIGNVMFNAADGSLAAILDWELAALGDPLLDLGRLLAAWPDADGEGPLSLKVLPWDGFPDRDALIGRYAAGSGRNMAWLLWYEVLACYKLGIILEGTYARACAGLVDKDVGARLHQSALALIARALGWLKSRG